MSEFTQVIVAVIAVMLIAFVICYVGEGQHVENCIKLHAAGIIRSECGKEIKP